MQPLHKLPRIQFRFLGLGFRVTDLNKNLSFIQIVPTHWPRIARQKAVAIFQIYSTGFQEGRDLERGPGLFDFDSEKYWPLKGDYQGKIYDGTNERLNSEIVDLICPAADRAVNQNVSIQDAINSIRKPSGFDISKELIPEFAEFSYAAMRIKAMAGEAVLLVRGYADGEEGAWRNHSIFHFQMCSTFTEMRGRIQ